ncbi:DUF1963 domain-containing protein [Streptomyces sp. NPDC088788]|uniref:DUF1963 domain-containing protein n=1 Tax=Streptomyces sp. NPDC088788 TaxID=3365898 RepID=UPI00381B4D54
MAYVDERNVTGLASEYGVPADVARELAGLLRPCVLLVRKADLPDADREDTLPAGLTGGLPPLPGGEDGGDDGSGPADPFVLAVDCAALPRDSLDIEIPSDGQLLFFTTFEYEPEESEVLHVPADGSTGERPSRDIVGGGPRTVVYERRPLYPVPGLTIDHDWRGCDLVRSFLDGDGESDGAGESDGRDLGAGVEMVDRFVEALVNSVHAGTPPHSVAQIGGFSDQWQVPPDQDGLVLLAQISGNGVDHGLFTLNLVVGTRQDIAAGRWENLHFEQQC